MLRGVPVTSCVKPSSRTYHSPRPWIGTLLKTACEALLIPMKKSDWTHHHSLTRCDPPVHAIWSHALRVRAWMCAPRFNIHVAPPTAACHPSQMSLFYRGIGVHHTRGFFYGEKMDLLCVVASRCSCSCFYLQLAFVWSLLQAL